MSTLGSKTFWTEPQWISRTEAKKLLTEWEDLEQDNAAIMSVVLSVLGGTLVKAAGAAAEFTVGTAGVTYATRKLGDYFDDKDDRLDDILEMTRDKNGFYIMYKLKANKISMDPVRYGSYVVKDFYVTTNPNIRVD